MKREYIITLKNKSDLKKFYEEMESLKARILLVQTRATQIEEARKRSEERLEKKKKNLVISYKWDADVKGFDMPIKMTTSPGKMEWVTPTEEWQTITVKKMKPGSFELGSDWAYFLEDRLGSLK